MEFCLDDSILLDHFVNQRKLFILWQDGIDTYQKLDSVSFEKFQVYMGGLNSSFFRKQKNAVYWLTAHWMNRAIIESLNPYMSKETSCKLYRAGIWSLADLVKKSDYDLACIFQQNLIKKETLEGVSSITKARIREIKYVFFMTGTKHFCMPL